MSASPVGISIEFVRKFPARVELVVGDSALDQPDESKGFWVSYDELSQIVAVSFRDRRIVWDEDFSLNFGYLFDLFGRVEIDAEGRPLLTWANNDGYVIAGSPPLRNPCVFENLHVTERWANGVLSLVNKGIVKVFAERVPNVDNPHATEGLFLPFGYDLRARRFSILPHKDSVFVAVPASQ